MPGGSKKAKKKAKENAKRRSDAPQTSVVVELHLDLRPSALASAGEASSSRGEVERELEREGVRLVDAPPKGAIVAAVAPPEATTPATGDAEGALGARIGPPAVPLGEVADAPAVEGGPAWPLGPHYLRWVTGKGADAWARYKLKSADWYLKALESAEHEVGLDRHVGVLMAIDGVLSSLCAGVDAAGHALLDEVEHLAGTSGRPLHPVPPPVPEDWTGVLALAERVGAELGSARAIAKALGGDEPEEPDGWLSQLRRLQRLAVRRNVLLRRPSVEGGSRSRLLDVPGLGQRPVTRYLETTCRRADGLVEALLADVESLADERLRLTPRPSGGESTLPDLAKRADVLGARWHGIEPR